MVKTSLLVGSKIFSDSLLKIYNTSKELEGSILFQLAWDDLSNSSVSISCGKDCVVIVALWDHEYRQDSLMKLLQLNDWMLHKRQQIW